MVKKGFITPFQKQFIIIFIACCLIYSYLGINYLWGNHDWAVIHHDLKPWHFLFDGRYSTSLLHYLFFDGKILPILNWLIACCSLTLTACLLANYWKIPVNSYSFLLFGIFYISLPWHLNWFYYTQQTANFIAPLFAIGGLLLAEKNKKWLSCFCLYIALGYYAPIISLIIICFLGKIFIEKKPLKQYKEVFLSLSLALFYFLLTLEFLKIGHFIKGIYTTEVSTLSVMAKKFLQTPYFLLSQLFITKPFLELKYKLFLLPLVLGLFIQKQRPLSYLLLLLMLASTAIPFLLSPIDIRYWPRIESFGLIYIYAFSLAYFLQKKEKACKNLISVLVVILIFTGVKSNLDAEKVWTLGLNAEMKLQDRVLSRIHITNTPKTFIQIGTIPLRSLYYPTKTLKDDTLLDYSFTAVWNPENALQFYSTDKFIKKSFYYPAKVFWQKEDERKQHLINIQQFIETAETWPHINSVYQDNDYIAISYTTKALTETRRFLNTD